MQVCLHWPGEYAGAARKQRETGDPAVLAKLNVAFETELVQRLGVGQPAHDFWHLYRGAHERGILPLCFASTEEMLTLTAGGSI